MRTAQLRHEEEGAVIISDDDQHCRVSDCFGNTQVATSSSRMNIYQWVACYQERGYSLQRYVSR